VSHMQGAPSQAQHRVTPLVPPTFQQLPSSAVATNRPHLLQEAASVNGHVPRQHKVVVVAAPLQLLRGWGGGGGGPPPRRRAAPGPQPWGGGPPPPPPRGGGGGGGGGASPAAAGRQQQQQQHLKLQQAGACALAKWGVGSTSNREGQGAVGGTSQLLLQLQQGCS
jgi:hypothetical protein